MGPVHPCEAPDGGHAILDLRELERYVGEGAAAQREFLGDFREAMASHGPKIKEAVASGRLEEAADLAHRLKSPSRAVGALTLAELCVAIEAAGKAGHAVSAQAAAEQLPAVMAAVDRVVAARLDGEGI